MDESPELPLLAPEVTYLRTVALESQELFQELRYAAFTEKQATEIVARMVSDALNLRNEDIYYIEYVDEDDEDDEDELYDGDDS